MNIITLKDLSGKLGEEFYKTISYENSPDIDKIIQKTKEGKDDFLIDISAKFGDGNFTSADDFAVSKEEIKIAYSSVSFEFVENIKIAKENVMSFAQAQLECIKNLDIKKNSSLMGHKIFPLNRVLCYVPGGNYPLPSSCIMTVVPAKVAGVKDVVLTSPRIKPETIVAADIAGADKIYKLGGAQSIAAFAYGTETISPVDKIVGPGNKFVTYAKKSVYGVCDIDFLAGPSEVLVIADESANPKLIAADMLAQAEHDKDARAYLITTSKKLAFEVQKEAEAFLQELKTSSIAQVSFNKSFALVVDSLIQAADVANKRAPEHLEIMVKNEDEILPYLKNFGSLFIGENCAEVFGDYVSGTNHVLPTNCASKYTGGLSVFDFIKILTYQKIDKNYAQELSKTACYIANSEGLLAHSLASKLRGI